MGASFLEATLKKKSALHTIDLKLQLTKRIPLRVRVRQLRLEEYMRNRFGDFGGLQIWQTGVNVMAEENKVLGPAELVDYHKWLASITGCAVVQINDLDDMGNEVWRKMTFKEDEDITATDGKFAMTLDQFDFDDNFERVTTWALKNLNEGPGPEPATFRKAGHDNVRVDGEDVRDAAARVPTVGAEHAGSENRKLVSRIRHPGNELPDRGTGTAAGGSEQESQDKMSREDLHASIRDAQAKLDDLNIAIADEAAAQKE